MATNFDCGRIYAKRAEKFCSLFFMFALTKLLKTWQNFCLDKFWIYQPLQVFIIRYSMEKLVAKKIQPNKKATDKKKLQSQRKKRMQKAKKTSLIKQFFCHHKRLVICLLIQFLMTSVFLFLSFFNNKYFLFLNRPKIFQTSNLLAFMLFLYVIFNNIMPFLSNFAYFKTENKDKTCKKNFDKRRKSFVIFSIINSVIICLFLAGFLCKVLWLCVFLFFGLFAISFIELFKQPTRQLTLLAIIKFLLATLLLLSVYYIYLLN